MSTTGTSSSTEQQKRQSMGSDPDSDYSQFLAHVKTTFKNAVADPETKLFYVTLDPADAPDADHDLDGHEEPLALFDHYLAHISPSKRQVHNCAACRSFTKRYGGLVTVSKKGKIKSAIWNTDNYDGPYANVIEAMRTEVESASIKGVFLTKDATLGHVITGGYGEPVWHHLSVQLPRHLIFSDPLKTAKQRMALKRDQYKYMVRAISEFSIDTVNQAVALLESGTQLYRGDAVLGPAKFFQETLLERAGTANRQYRANLLWKRIASAPDGFLRPRSSMIGTLLEDLQSGMNFDLVKKRFAEKMSPTQYMRAQVAPKAGNINQAETIIKKLNAAGALERRFARLDEIQTIWNPQPVRARDSDEGGVFSHVKAKGVPSKTTDLQPIKGLTPSVITWSVFRQKVLPEAVRIQAHVPQRAGFGAYTTAAYEDAEPIMQWDSLEQRNPFAWYTYPHGSFAHQWGLPVGQFVDVLGISVQPPQWFDESKHSNQSAGILLVLPNCRDSEYKSAGNALFPQCLRSELHEVRATIEAYSRTALLAGFDAPNLAAGIKFGKDNNLRGYVLRVQRKDGTVLSYALDRWE